MKKMQILYLLLISLVLLPTQVNAALTGEEVILNFESKLDELFPEDKYVIRVADLYVRDMYATYIEDAPAPHMPYEEYAMGTTINILNLYKEDMFGDYLKIDTGLTDGNNNKIYADAELGFNYQTKKATVGYSYSLGETGDGISKDITIELSFVESDAHITDLVDYYKSEILKDEDATYEDLYWINMLLASDLKGLNATPTFKDAQYMTSYFTKLEEGLSMAIFQERGFKTPLEVSFTGYLPLFYNGVLYELIDCKIDNSHSFSFNYSSTINIPDDTEETNYINAATKRIEDYINNDDYEVVITRTDTTLEDYEQNTMIANVSIKDNALPYLYNLNIKNKNDNVEYDHKFLIKKVPIEEITTPMVQYLDKTYNIIMETQSSDIPPFSKINVTKIDENSQRQEQIELYLKNDKAVAFDINLESYQGLISVINNGHVTVKIPLPEGFDESATEIYYVADNGNRGDIFECRYETINGIRYVVFDTTHFSTYVVAERVNNNVISNPETNDGIMNFIIIGCISLISLIGVKLYSKKNRFN